MWNDDFSNILRASGGDKHYMAAWDRLFTDDVVYVNRGGGWWNSNTKSATNAEMIGCLSSCLINPS